MIAGLTRRWRRARVGSRLAAATAAVMTLIVAVLGTASYIAIRHELDWQLNLSLRRQVDALLAGGRHWEIPWSSSASCGIGGTGYCVATIAKGTPVGGASPTLPVTEGAVEVAEGRADSAFSDIVLHGTAGRMLAVPISGGALLVAVQSQTYENSVARLNTVLALLGGASVLLAAAGGWFVARAGTGAVSRLTETAELIAATGDPRRRADLPIPVEPGSRDEVARLAVSFDTMLLALEESLAAQRQLVADASHELRTPLTALRTNIDILAFGDQATQEQRDRAVRALGTQLRSVTSLVNDLIELARGREHPALVEEVRLDELLLAVVETARSHWSEIEFAVRTAPALVTGVPARLARLLSTLLDNAAKFSPRGGVVEVTAGRAEITVRDHGPGIAAEDLPYIFDQFYRSRTARSLPGSGLGLAMARQIAASHDATLDAERAEGGGTLFRVRFPGSAPRS